VSWPRALLMMISLLACGCEARPVDRPEPLVAGKQAMFGDAGLVPTREGERARRELAIAGELEQALARLGLVAAHVDVELREPVAVIVIARLPTGSDADAITDTITELARAMLPALDPDNLHVWLEPASAQPAEPERRRGPRLWALMLTCVGLGLSLGVLGERLRSRW
jgi:type III secretory pathway lipoprotein EscJ